MSGNTQPLFAAAPKTGSASIVNADGTAIKTLYTGGPNGTRISKVSLVSNDTANKDIALYIGGVQIGTVQCPLGAGATSAVPGKDVLGDSNFKHAYNDSNGNLVIDLPSGVILGVAALVAVTAAKTIIANCLAADY